VVIQFKKTNKAAAQFEIVLVQESKLLEENTAGGVFPVQDSSCINENVIQNVPYNANKVFSNNHN